MKPCKKVSYQTEYLAINAILKIRLYSSRQIKPIRAYLCECGSWHLTSKRLTEETQDTIKNLNKQLSELKAQHGDLKRKYLLKIQNHSKELNKQTEIIKKNELITKKDKTIKMLRETISKLITKLNQLEK